MKASLLEYSEGLSNLHRYIEGLKIENELLSTAANTENPSVADCVLMRYQEHIKGAYTKKRRFDYNTTIVSLYGYLEQFIESIIRAYIEYLSSVVPDYADLPEALNKSHLQVSLNLITHTRLARYRGTITPEQVISNLHSCFSGKEKYRLNSDAYALHTANYRADVIDEAFAKFGVIGVKGRLANCTGYATYIESAFPGVKVDSITPQELHAPLDDLAERRNEVAHGSNSEVLSNDYLQDYIAYFQAFGTSLYEILRCEAVPYDLKLCGKTLGSPIRVINKRIICIPLRKSTIRVGDVLVAQTENASRPYIEGEIKELQIDGMAYPEITTTSEVNIGIRIDFPVRMNQTFFLLPQLQQTRQLDLALNVE